MACRQDSLTSQFSSLNSYVEGILGASGDPKWPDGDSAQACICCDDCAGLVQEMTEQVCSQEGRLKYSTVHCVTCIFFNDCQTAYRRIISSRWNAMWPLKTMLQHKLREQNHKNSMQHVLSTLIESQTVKRVLWL